MNASKRLSCILIFVTLTFMSVSFITPVSAIVPVVQDVVVWNSSGDTILNVTVFHDPEISTHYVDAIEVNVGGNITSFPVDVQPTTTFTIQCNLGPIAGTPSVTVRAHCIIHGYSTSFGPSQIPEFSPLFLLLTLILITLLVVFVIRQKREKIKF